MATTKVDRMPRRADQLQKGSYYVDIAAMAVLLLTALVVLYLWSRS